MTTARSIIEKALRKISVLGRGESLNADEANDAFDALNDLIGSWSVEGGLVFNETQETFNLTSASSYTIGTGGDFNTQRPVDIRLITVNDGSTDSPLNQLDQIEFGKISQKNTQGIPSAYYYNANAPLGTIYFSSVPNSNYTTTIYSFKPITEFSSLDATYSLPAGYERALVFNLAIDLAPDYNKLPNEAVVRSANESKGAVYAANSQNENNSMTVDQALNGGGRFDIYRGF